MELDTPERLQEEEQSSTKRQESQPTLVASETLPLNSDLSRVQRAEGPPLDQKPSATAAPLNAKTFNFDFHAQVPGHLQKHQVCKVFKQPQRPREEVWCLLRSWEDRSPTPVLAPIVFRKDSRTNFHRLLKGKSAQSGLKREAVQRDESKASPEDTRSKYFGGSSKNSSSQYRMSKSLS